MTNRERVTITLLWRLTQVVVFALLVLGCGVEGGAISRNSTGVVIGSAIGVVVATWLCLSGRMWLLVVRLDRLRREGVEAQATVMTDRVYTPLGRRRGDLRYPNERSYGPAEIRYTVYLRWVDPRDGTLREGERRYRLTGSASARFERVMAGMRVTVRYDRRRPSRFVLDIPFAPSMADLIR